MMKLKIVIYIYLIIFLWSCANENVEDVLGVCPNPPNTVTYSGDVVSILQNNCYECHAASVATDGIILEGYSHVKSLAEAGLLHEVINHLPNVTPMPYGRAKLSPCDIAKIEKWIELGALDD
jgi:hypothetical protein